MTDRRPTPKHNESKDTAARAEPRPALSFPTDVGPLAPTPQFLEMAQAYGLSFDDGDLERLGRYLAMVQAANALLNLTAITDTAEMWVKHIFDSLTLLPMLAELPEGAAVADVGSGAGLPCVPLAITMPGLRFVAIESTAKKSAFIAAAAGALGLGNVEVIGARAEDVTGSWVERTRSRREAYDAVVARAVGRMAVLVEVCAPLAKVGGLLLLVKGQKAEEELAEAERAITTVGCRHAGTVETPTGRVVALEKERPTARLYPRRAGEAAKSPL